MIRLRFFHSYSSVCMLHAGTPIAVRGHIRAVGPEQLSPDRQQRCTLSIGQESNKPNTDESTGAGVPSPQPVSGERAGLRRSSSSQKYCGFGYSRPSQFGLTMAVFNQDGRMPQPRHHSPCASKSACSLACRPAVRARSLTRLLQPALQFDASAVSPL
jgi:hypothetical protein